MPNLWDKLPEAPSPPELNPLTNPLLERNLRRWAAVYFGNAPAKREQAVSNLLEEIKREAGADPENTPGRSYFARISKLQETVCSSCQHQNPPGRRFCSRCGQPLATAQNASTTGAVVGAVSTENISFTEKAAAENRSPAEVPAAAGITETLPPRPLNDMTWLRDRAFDGFEGSEAPQKTWKYMAGAVVIVFASFAYLQWAPGLLSGITPVPQSSAPSASRKNIASSKANSPTANSPVANPVSNASSSPANRPVENPLAGKLRAETNPPESRTPNHLNSSGIAGTHEGSALPAGLQRASQKATLLEVPRSTSQSLADQEGSPDLRLAQRYLGGSMGVRDPSEAAKLLWKAVSKQNAAAAVLLSDLYARGDGVPRSCDQARLLLIAALKRGSSQAAIQFRNLESQGCR